jgi:hypothetical protein
MAASCSTYLHNHPESIAGARICPCDECVHVLRTLARLAPRTEVALRTDDDRIVCTAGVFSQHLSSARQPLFDPAGIRDAWIVGHRVLVAPATFASLREAERRITRGQRRTT